MECARRCIPRCLLTGLFFLTSQAFAEVPDAGFDLYRLDEGGFYKADVTHGWLANDRDADGDMLSIAGISRLPEYGELSWKSDGSFIYTPNPGFSGNDRVHYQLRDDNGDSAIGLVIFHVRPRAGFPTDQDWLGAGNDSGHSGYQSGFLKDSAPELLWQYDAGPEESYYLPPAVADGQVFISTAFWKPSEIPQSQYGLTSRSLRTGALLWRAPIDSGQKLTPPSIDRDHAYVQGVGEVEMLIVVEELEEGR